MTNQVSLVRVVVASPSDVGAERDVVSAVAEELNRGIVADRGLRLEIARWETDSYPGFHPEGPQGLIDPILRIQDCDLLIGIFWKRFGTPVTDAGSGTEHEFKLAYETWKKNQRPQIMIYFNQQSYTPKSRVEAEQWSKVLAFRESFPQEGLWWDYTGVPQFQDFLRNHLTQFIRNNYPLPNHGVAPPSADEPKVSLWIHGWIKHNFGGQPTIELDWTSYFDRDSRSVPDQATWDQTLFPELKRVKAQLASTSDGSFIDLRGKLSLTALLAIGAAFPQVGGYRFRFEQPTEGKLNLWRSDAGASNSKLKVCLEEERPSGQDLLVGLAITGKAQADFRALWDQQPSLFKAMVYLEPENGPSDKSITSDADAVALAGHAKALLREFRQKYQAARIHLALYAPAAFSLFLGQRFSAVGEVVTYERTQEGGYQISVTLKTG